MSVLRLQEPLSRLSAFVDRHSQFWSPDKAPSELFHYTSADAFVGIVTTKSIWASDMFSLIDASEADYPCRLIEEVLDTYHADVSEVHRQRFKTQLTQHLFRLYTPFVTCFCEDGDLLSQWRGHGGEGEGFAVGLSVPWLLSLETIRWRLQKVIYDRDQQVDLILMYLQLATSILDEGHFSEAEQITFWQEAAAQLPPWVVMFKDPAFKEEQEWRLVNVDPQSRSSFRHFRHRIVSYVHVPLNGEAITRLIRGPYFRGTDQRGAYSMLVSNGFTMGANIDDSKIPLRK